MSVNPSQPLTLSDGTVVRIRPIRPDDEPMMVAFHRSLSPDSVYSRYSNVLKLTRRTAHARLSAVCHPDPLLDTVLVAEVFYEKRKPEIAGVGRISRSPETSSGEVAIIVSDALQRRGLGKELVRRLILAAREKGLARILAHVLRGNLAMERLCASAGMRISDRLASDAEAVPDVTMCMNLSA